MSVFTSPVFWWNQWRLQHRAFLKISNTKQDPVNLIRLDLHLSTDKREEKIFYCVKSFMLALADKNWQLSCTSVVVVTTVAWLIPTLTHSIIFSILSLFCLCFKVINRLHRLHKRKYSNWNCGLYFICGLLNKKI